MDLHPQARPRKGEDGYDPNASPEDSDSGVALVPSAPPLHCDLEAVLAGSGDLLSLEPPTWVPDSHAGDCTACHQPFRSYLRQHLLIKDPAEQSGLAEAAATHQLRPPASS